MSRRYLLAVTGTFALMSGVPATFAQDSDTLVIARSMDVNSLDPARAFCDTCQIYLSATYETLVTLAPDNPSLVPALATSWDINPETTQFTFHLTPEAVFADGSPVEAKDVAWSLQRLLNLKGSPAFLMDGMTAIEEVDPKTVRITVAAPDSEFINKISASYAGIINSDVAI
jgi:peptide/nickel transport system substrate-binding protein